VVFSNNNTTLKSWNIQTFRSVLPHLYGCTLW
jgi:hypothetical protein